MKKSERQAHAALILAKLEALRDEWHVSTENLQPKEKDVEISRRERLKTLEAETSLLRLMQSEERLFVQLAVGARSFVDGSAHTLLFNTLVG